MTDMPYKRNGGCDLCGRMAPLSRVELAEGSKTKLPRVAYVCDGHPDMAGAPFVAPRTRMVPGTHRLAPQGESLF